MKRCCTMLDTRNVDLRLKQQMRRAVRTAIKRGNLVRPKTCNKCGTAPGHTKNGRTLIEAHHHNGYDDPLDVIWLCSRCHHYEHVRNNGIHHTVEVKQQRRESLKRAYAEGRQLKQFGKDNPFFGQHHTLETRTKISQRSGWHHTLEAREKIRAASTGKHPTVETRAKTSVALQGKKTRPGEWHHTNESRAKISVANTGKRRTPETCAKIRVAKQTLSAITREKMRVSSHNRWHINRNLINLKCEYCRKMTPYVP